MPPLHDVLAALAGRPDAHGALVVSDEGLVIDAVLPPGSEAEAIAAHAATAFRTMRGLTDSLRHGAPRQSVIDSEHGVVVLSHLTRPFSEGRYSAARRLCASSIAGP